MSTSERPGLIQLTPAAAHGELRVLGQRPLGPEARARLERRAKVLAWVVKPSASAACRAAREIARP
jgi:hypothetical protein